MRRDSELTQGLRSHVPAMQFAETRGWKFFDGPSGTQMVDGCIDAITAYVSTGIANRRQVAPTGDETEEIIARARQETQKFLGAEGYQVIFGQNMTSLAFELGHALARQVARPDTAIVVSELEHFGNVDPWAQTFGERGSETQWLPVDPDSLHITDGSLEDQLGSRDVVLVAVTLASNAVGTVPNVAQILSMAKSAGAITVIDGVQAVPHLAVDLAELGPDIFLWSAYKCYGPHLGIALVTDALAEELRPYKVGPALDAVPDKFETGTQSHEAIAGLVGTLDTLAQLSEGVGGSGAREAIRRLASAEDEIADWLEGELRGLPKVRVYRPAKEHGERTPVVAFRVDGQSPNECAEALRKLGLFITHGDLYARALAERLGIADRGGWARAGISGYTRWNEAEELCEGIAGL